MNDHLDEIIRLLGYSESPCLYRSNYDSSILTAHTVKVLKELSPYAAYMVDDRPFVLFFNKPSTLDEKKEINKKIWNAQIPVVIFCGTSDVRILSGCTIDKKTSLLVEAERLRHNKIDENSPFSFWDITCQDFWKNYVKYFSGEKLIDALLNDLTYLIDRLRNVYHVKFAAKLMLKLIFIRYLIDRGVDLDYSGFSSDVAASREELLKLLDDKFRLYALFSHLEGKFKGNLFELGDEYIDSLSKSALREMKDFLSANIDSPAGRLSQFDLYDFSIIPVELIGNIYEIILGKDAQDKEKEKDDFFCAPSYLVKYVLDMTISPHIKKHKTCRILDPSCGSGAFLVDSYRRMIESKLNGAPYTDDDEMLRKTMTDSIFGVDRNESAIDVAVFSLHIAMLDYKNPKTLKQFRLPILKGVNLFVCNFFDFDKLLLLQKMSFDFIVGNPPWRNKKGLHKKYCEKYGYVQYLRQNDSSSSIVLRSKDFCGANTKCCFVLKSTMLYIQEKPSVKFREFLLANTEIIRIVELSSVRKNAFINAEAPAVIFSYKFSDKNARKNHFEHISIKPNIFFRLFNIIVVERTDVKRVQQKLLKENDWVWKTLVYGLTGDIDNIIKLKNSFPTLRHSITEQTPMLLTGTGVRYFDGDQKDASHLLGRRLLQFYAVDHFSINMKSISVFEKTHVDNPSDENIFHAPYCLVSAGIDTESYTLRAVYSEADFVFQYTMYAIKGSTSQKPFLKNLTGLFNSSFYSYLLLLLDPSLGIKKAQVVFEEVLDFPYVFNEDIVEQVDQIQETIKKSRKYIVSRDASDKIRLLNRTILEAFRLTENEFVDYALRIQIPLLTRVNDCDVYREADTQDLWVYGKYFFDFLSAIFKDDGVHVRINAYPTVAKHYSAIEVVVLDVQPAVWFTVNNNDENIKYMHAKLSAHKINESFHSLMETLYFEDNSFYIIKPSSFKNWHPAIAKHDLMEAADKILDIRKKHKDVHTNSSHDECHDKELSEMKKSVLKSLESTILSRKEIFMAIGKSGDHRAFRRVIEPLLADNYIEMTIPDKPNSSLQKYRLTDKGVSAIRSAL